jgi:two-component system OmpR family sensor kinase
MAAGLAIIFAVLVAAGALILGIQTNYLTSQLDQRMDRQLANAVTIATSGGTVTNPAAQPRRGRGLADMYIAVLTGSGMQTINTPETDPGLTPIVDPNHPPTTPTTVPATAGQAHRMRVATAALPAGGTLVFGGSMGDIDAAVTRLRATLTILGAAVVAVVVLVFWWLRRLGLDPILRVTRVANAISAGDTNQRVEAFPAGTEAHDLGAAFNQLVDTNEETQAMLRQFVADASHELRTPLVTLKGYASLYGAGGLADAASTADAMRRIKAEANRMGRLVEDLLLLAELDKGPQPHTEQVDLVPILSDLANDLAVLDPARNVTLSTPQSAVIPGDPDQLTQVFAGLAGNAMRHTPAGTAIELRITSGGSMVRVEVSDHGPGIPPADLERVFARFYRADLARSSSAGGSGLGLAIAAAIVKAHSGRIGVVSPPGQGATFWVELPLGPALPTAAEADRPNVATG